MKYSKVIVVLVIVLNIIFTGVVFGAVYNGFEEPTTLIISWFAFTGTELLSLAGIKISEFKYLQQPDSNEQEVCSDDEEE